MTDDFKRARQTDRPKWSHEWRGKADKKLANRSARRSMSEAMRTLAITTGRPIVEIDV